MATEAWMRGPLAGYATELQPVAHSLVQAREELQQILGDVDVDRLHARVGVAATAAFHIRHMAGSLDRLLTYARGAMLTDEQLAARATESVHDNADADALRAVALESIDAALRQVRETDPRTLADPREVGRKRLPSTVGGLLFHAAEHTARHVGQLRTTLRMLGRDV
ncbi:MAG TPA: DinB family protein [Longimicrobiales bacterium]|nr:DinB family protein [Longimicrobiales bacterium]